MLHRKTLVTLGVDPTWLFRGSNHNVPISHSSFFAALKINGPWQFFVAAESPTSDPWNLLVVDDGLAILDNGDHSSDECDIETLPFSGLARQLRRGGKEAVHPTHMVTWWFLRRAAFHLHLATAPQIDAAIRSRSAFELKM